MTGLSKRRKERRKDYIFSDNMATAIDDRQELLEQFQAVSLAPLQKLAYFGSRRCWIFPGFPRSGCTTAPAIARGFLSIAGFINVEAHPRARPTSRRNRGRVGSGVARRHLLRSPELRSETSPQAFISVSSLEKSFENTIVYRYPPIKRPYNLGIFRYMYICI